MNAGFGAAIARPVSQSRILAGIRIGPADDLNLAKNILARVRKIPGAIARLMAGPPRSERERFNYEVTAARARAIEGISSGWIRFR